MGLLLGASVLSFMEIVDLFFYNSVRKCADYHRSRVHPVKARDTVNGHTI